MIGDDILVTVMEVSASTVRLGIEAPRGVSIFREEIWLAVKEENRAAAEAQADALPSAPVARPGHDSRQAAAEPAEKAGSTGQVEPSSAPIDGPRGDTAASEQQAPPPRDASS